MQGLILSLAARPHMGTSSYGDLLELLVFLENSRLGTDLKSPWEATSLYHSSHSMELCKTSAEEGVESCVKWAGTDGPTQGTSSGPAVLFGVTLWIPHLFYSSTVTSCPCLYELSGSRQEHGNGKNPQ